MARATRWHRGAADATILEGTLAYYTPDAFMTEGETLLRLRWRYQVLASAPAGNLIAMFHPGAHAIVDGDHSLLSTFGHGSNPLTTPTLELQTQRTWMWWESWSYRHWNPVSSDARWYGPADELERDSHAQRTQTGGFTTNNYTISFLWGIREDIDWQFNDVYISYSALVMFP